MKALTLWQPWATLVALQQKKIETRSWATTYRGTLAIHAAQNFPQEAKDLVFTEPFYSALQRPLEGDKSEMVALPSGAIVAVCEIETCLKIPSDQKQIWQACRNCAVSGYKKQVILPPPTPEFAFGDYTPGRYAWLLTNIRALKRPIPCRGYQQLWAVPAHIIQQIKEQLECTNV